jgi:hypothetical protein
MSLESSRSVSIILPERLVSSVLNVGVHVWPAILLDRDHLRRLCVAQPETREGLFNFSVAFVSLGARTY